MFCFYLKDKENFKKLIHIKKNNNFRMQIKVIHIFKALARSLVTPVDEKCTK